MHQLLALTALVGVTLAVSAQEKPKTGFMDKVYKNPDGHDSPYVVFVPQDYDGTKAVPVILFLHGSGETKGGKMMPVEQGIAEYIKGKHEKTFPAIVLIPQAETRSWQADGPNAKRALTMLDAVMKEYKCDANRVYLTGLSMGGYGTWSLAAAHPKKWAAIVPICGGGDPTTAAKIKDIPCWVWHGDEDKAVPASKSRDMIAALNRAGGKPRYNELKGVGHNSWDTAYGEDALYTWLFAQKKK